MQMKTTIALLVLLTACSGEDPFDQPYTWGDVVDEFSVAFCGSLQTCSLISETERCVEHAYWHMCDGWDTCDTPVDEFVAREALVDCVIDFENPTGLSCVALQWGNSPRSCNEVWELQPEHE